MVVALSDGRNVSVPLAWFPRLLGASPKQRAHWQLIGAGLGIHWRELDEDISVSSLLRPEGCIRMNPTEKTLSGSVRVDYDEGADVLYVSLRHPQRATDTEEAHGGVLVRKRGQEIVGITILNARQRLGVPTEWMPLGPGPLPCPDCGNGRIFRTVETHTLPDGFSIPNLPHWKCRRCRARFFDDVSMHLIETARKNRPPTLSPISVPSRGRRRFGAGSPRPLRGGRRGRARRQSGNRRSGSARGPTATGRGARRRGPGT